MGGPSERTGHLQTTREALEPELHTPRKEQAARGQAKAYRSDYQRVPEVLLHWQVSQTDERVPGAAQADVQGKVQAEAARRRPGGC